MKRHLRLFALCLAAALFFCCCSASPDVQPSSGAVKTAVLDPHNPVTITIWHYYNGTQQAKFSEFAEEFNTTKGAELGIRVEENSLGSVTDLTNSVLASARKQVGADKLPNIFSAYEDTAFAVDQLGLVADLAPYFTADELALYRDEYLSEGGFSGDGCLKIFPVAKSTEVLVLNQTDWDIFAKATGAQLSALSTMEGVTDTAKAYYEWTDALTPDIPNDGKAMFGRDAFANYMLVGAEQIGTEMLHVEDNLCTLNFDRDTVRRLWDNYYIPMVAGWFAESNRFRSDDMKMGNLIACVSSTSSATYFSPSVLTSDTESYPIELAALPAPEFSGGQPYAVQQGAGMVVTKGSDAEEYACTVFLKWFTEASRNAAFCVASGYMPVTRQASTLDYLAPVMDAAQTEPVVRTVLSAGISTLQNNTLYTQRAFINSNTARDILNDAMPSKAADDRAIFLDLLSQGVSYEDALAQFNTEDNFEAWYVQTLSRLKQLPGVACVG
jgi:multiple sugar transport system substrate-binding protein